MTMKNDWAWLINGLKRANTFVLLGVGRLLKAIGVGQETIAAIEKHGVIVAAMIVLAIPAWLVLMLLCVAELGKDKGPTDSSSSIVGAIVEQTNSTSSIVSARDLVAYYKIDEVAANKDYRGKKFAVSGNVLMTTKLSDGSALIVLMGDDELEGVQCQCDPGYNKSRFAALNDGDRITVYGKCMGILHKRPIFAVMMWECELQR